MAHYIVGKSEFRAVYNSKHDILAVYRACFKPDATWEHIKPQVYIYKCSVCHSLYLYWASSRDYKCGDLNCDGVGVAYKVYPRWRWNGIL